MNRTCFNLLELQNENNTSDGDAGGGRSRTGRGDSRVDGESGINRADTGESRLGVDGPFGRIKESNFLVSCPTRKFCSLIQKN